MNSALGVGWGEEQIREAARLLQGEEPRWGPSLLSQLAPQVLSLQMFLTPLRPLCLFPARGEFPGINTSCLAKQCRPGPPQFLPANPFPIYFLIRSAYVFQTILAMYKT